jgi:hypothetical protein
MVTGSMESTEPRRNNGCGHVVFEIVTVLALLKSFRQMYTQIKRLVFTGYESNIDNVERVNVEAVRLVGDSRFHPVGMGRSR